MDEILYLQIGKISSLEIFHSMLYDKRFEKYFQHEDVKKLISGLTELEFISNDVSRLTALVLKTNKENNVKKILNDLFYKSKSEGWTRHDLSIANAYLLQKNVEHLDLLEHVKQHDKKLYNYYKLYCAGRKTFSNWAEVILLSDKVILENKFKISNRTEQLYFLYLKNRHLKDWLIAYSYYKSYFDRKTAEFAGYLEKEKPNYKAFYNRNKLCEFYSSISGSQEIIKQAHRNRNRNPSIHAKAELLSLDSEHKELIKVIEKLEALLLKKKEEIS